MCHKIAFLLFVFAGLLAAVGTVAAFKLPDTGQIACYDEYDQIACPAEGEPYYGQDAQYETYRPAYQDNANGTVSDVVTGLMWQQAEGNSRSWGQAKFYCEGLATGGHNNWRVPEFHELESLILYGKDPAFDDAFFTRCASRRGTWSASEHAVLLNDAWYIDFYDGWQGVLGKSYEFCVRCVRDRQ